MEFRRSVLDVDAALVAFEAYETENENLTTLVPVGLDVADTLGISVEFENSVG
jgi:hypothetical protein